MAPKKAPLSELLQTYGLAPSPKDAEAYIRAGEIQVAGHIVDKPGTLVPVNAKITRTPRTPYVSRGGLKLKAALDHFEITVADKVCADLGASTGGFTDVLLQSGAKKVYAVDTAHGELDWKLRSDPRVVVTEKTNARYLTSLPEPTAFISVDISLLSLTKLVPTIRSLLSETGDIIALIKPQYEATPEELPTGGVVTDPAVHQKILARVINSYEVAGFTCNGTIESPIRGEKGGNKEFLVWFKG